MKKKLILILAIISMLISGTAYSAEKNVLLKTTKTWDNEQYQKLKIKKPEVTVLKISIAPGEVLHMHKHDIVNIAYVEKGTLTVITDKNEQITVQEGECLPEIIGKYHYGKNSGKNTLVLVVFYVGEKGTPLSVDKK